jgi:hypothetical protein
MPDSNDIKEIGEMLDAVSGRLPKLISGLLDTLYSASAGEKMGLAVGNFYKGLIDSGIPASEAVNMARDYMLTIKDITGALRNKEQTKPKGTEKEQTKPKDTEG